MPSAQSAAHASVPPSPSLPPPTTHTRPVDTDLPDVEAVRREGRSGGGRKWQTLASALHHETKAFMMVRGNATHLSHLHP